MTEKRKAKAARGRIEHGCVSGRSTDVVGTFGFSAAGFRQGDAVYVVPAADMRRLRRIERAAKAFLLTYPWSNAPETKALRKAVS